MAYGSFALFYDRLTENVEYSRRADYFCSLLSSCGINDGTLLDLACGTGSLTIEFLKRGFDVIGVDSGAEMLSIAQGKAFQLGVNPLFLCQKMQELDLYGTVDAAVCALDSLNHLKNIEQIKKTFRRLSLFIRPGGVLVFDVNTQYKHREILGNNSFVYELKNLFCVWQNNYAGNGKVNINLDFFEQENGLWKRSSDEFSETAYDIELLSRLLKETGFEIKGIYDELTQNPLNEKSERAVFVSERKA